MYIFVYKNKGFHPHCVLVMILFVIILFGLNLTERPKYCVRSNESWAERAFINCNPSVPMLSSFLYDFDIDIRQFGKVSINSRNLVMVCEFLRIHWHQLPAR